jgi:hypothetical protein
MTMKVYDNNIVLLHITLKKKENKNEEKGKICR